MEGCIIRDYCRILVQVPVGGLLGRCRRYSVRCPDGACLPSGEGIYHPAVVRGRGELYSFASPGEVRSRLDAAGIPCEGLAAESLNLEDAFIGLTGKY